MPLPQRIKMPFILHPYAVWAISADVNGQIFAGWKSNPQSAESNQLIAHFERPDLIKISISPQCKDGFRINVGDTVASLHSLEAEHRIEQLQTDLEKALSELNAMKSGSRPEDVEVANRELTKRITERNVYLKEYERSQKLYQAGLLPEAEWDIIQGNLDLYNAEVNLAEAQINALKSGGRVEDIVVAEREVQIIRKSIENLISSITTWSHITSPISGTVKLGEIGEVLRIELVDSLIAYVMTPDAMLTRINPYHPVQLQLSALPGMRLQAYVSKKGIQREYPFSGYFTASIGNLPDSITPGMKGIAVLDIGKMTLWEWLKRMWNK